MKLATAALLLLASVTCTAQAQARDREIDEIVALVKSVETPLSTRHVEPIMIDKMARDFLKRFGEGLALGPLWHDGDPHWERARAVLVADKTRTLQAHGRLDKPAEERLRRTLAALSDAEIDELLRFYRSPLYARSVLRDDADLAAMVVMTLGQESGRDPATFAWAQDLSQYREKVALTPEEDKEFERVTQTPAYQKILVSNAQSNAESAKALSRTSVASASEIGVIVGEFRKANSIPPPPRKP